MTWLCEIAGNVQLGAVRVIYLHNFIRSANVIHVFLSLLSPSLSLSFPTSFFFSLAPFSFLSLSSSPCAMNLHVSPYSLSFQSFYSHLRQNYNLCLESISKKLTASIGQFRPSKKFPPSPFKKARAVSGIVAPHMQLCIQTCLFAMLDVMLFTQQPACITLISSAYCKLALTYRIH